MLQSQLTYYNDHVRTNYGKFNIHLSGPLFEIVWIKI